MASKSSPLPLTETLRDLALLLACDIDFSSFLPASKDSTDVAANTTDADKAVQRAFEFVKVARSALKILNREEVEKQGARVEHVRGMLEDVIQGLQTA